ncbi:MAG: cupredoxin family copper-binding protein [Nitrospirales bacterium]|nr:cupredoxin family copper-binding protein [Nitrospirales bacterium]
MMLQILITLFTILVVNGEAVSQTASLPRQHIVEIQAFRFQPQRVVVKPGDTIVWVNRDIVPHTVTANGGTWKSHPLGEGQSWQVVVEANGVSSYFCEFHPHMTGVLVTKS